MTRKLRHKFNARPLVVDNIHFSSQKESKYYSELLIRQKAGEVVGFLRQTALHLPGNIRYVLDFLVFYADGTCEGIEVKGYATEAWKLKHRLALEAYDWLPIRVVK
jgi:hypothetical protein